MKDQPARRTYFGPVALLVAMLAALAISAHYTVAYLTISPSLFNQLNSLTTLSYCILTPLALGLGGLGIFFERKLKILSWLAVFIAIIPLLVILAQFVFSLLKYN